MTSYQAEKIFAAVESFDSRGLCVTCVDQVHPKAEGAILSGVGHVRADRTMVLCADDLIRLQTLEALINAPGAGAFMTRVVSDSPTLSRLQIDGGRVQGSTADQQAPIMTYNFCLRTTTLRAWLERINGTGQPLVSVVDDFISDELYTVDGSADSVGVNYPADIANADRWVERTSPG